MLEIRIIFCISLPSILLAMNTDNKSLNNTDSNIKPKVWVETGQMHQRVDSLVDHNENAILDDNNENQVSWVRRRDWHILSSGDSLYTNDARFVATHEPTQSTYTLQIKFVQKRDHGIYECQVATSTGVMSHYASLQVIVPEAFILGSGELHVDMGSALNLVCIIEKSPTPPQYVYWQRNNHMINYDDSRRDVSIETTPGPRTQSRLIIREPQISDSGNYTCSASNTEPASIYVTTRQRYHEETLLPNLDVHFNTCERHADTNCLAVPTFTDFFHFMQQQHYSHTYFLVLLTLQNELILWSINQKEI
ncbi:CLUMA_CG021283, isoform A [Clunio marinus]|uniref:CLUMA_CG021283, isoform A n=1 Tax=Clunio marinus TaxID=568069 RepID=A0A1J1JBI6_9DIPT|nr:CLUMA_CG021283, isoform A [Clunio marinus]